MFNPISKLTGLVGQNVAAASVIAIGSAVGLTALGFVVRPNTVLSMDATDDDDQTNFASLSEERARIVDALKRLIQSSHAVIDVREVSGATELLLWTGDQRNRGVVNDSEVLIISHAPLLEAVIAMRAIVETDDAMPLPSAALFSDTFALDWRRRPDVEQTVVTTNVTAMRITSVRRDDGTAALSVALTFAPDNPEEIEASHVEAMFVVTLPAVSRSR